MYDFLGFGILLILFWKQPSLSSYFMAAVSFSVAALAWYRHNVSVWFLSIAVAFACLTFASCYDLYNSTFLRKAYTQMPQKTLCCIPHVGCTNPRYVLVSTCVIRASAGIVSVLSCYISWSHRETFWEGDSDIVRVFWATTACTWLCSCLPHIVCLIQCAATNDSSSIYNFRKRVAFSLLHDIVLGIFWLYLVFMLDHLLKDDDSEWRTIFLSMISWHIIIFVIRELYFTDLWSVSKHVSCCAPSTRQRWGDILNLSSMTIIYGVLVHVIRDSVDMGCSVEHVILIISALVVGCFGKLLKTCQTFSKPKASAAPADKKKNNMLDF